ncbi:hypothetical protein GTY81_19895 [Streptomyces sp. SID8366]|nr:hypothetical protein [Streptomyces sp. PsTaAH-130]MYU06099.1 hypothetical protein [Streptomyces sp. SID8366]MYU61672.1 hypothetical protein [Streptomyces sp. SID69]
MTQHLAADRARGGPASPCRDFTATVRDLVAPVVTAGVEPASPDAAPVVAAHTAQYARLCGRPDDTALRRRLLRWLEDAHDPRRERHLQLLAVINRWPAPEGLAPVLTWSAEAIRTRTHTRRHPRPLRENP